MLIPIDENEDHRPAGVFRTTPPDIGGHPADVTGQAALQLTGEDIITGNFIIFENQYSVGDIIVLDDVRGPVRSIGVRTTVIEDAGGNLKVVNNSDIRNFQNRSRNTSLAIIVCAVSYDSDLRKLEQLMLDKLPGTKNNHPDLYLSDIKYMGVDELADSGVNLKFNVKAKEEKFFQAKRALNRDVKLLLDDNGFEIPFPQVVVHNGDLD